MNKPARVLLIISLAILLLSNSLLSQNYSEGSNYYGRNSYIEYRCGGLPLIISVPHGGNLTPSEIPDRLCGTTATDSYTKELALEISDAIYDITGRYPHLIINHLKRIKLDANRDEAEATCGDAEASIAWEEYHRFIDSAKLYVSHDYEKGLFIDLHGQSSHGERIELGYLLTGTELQLSDATLNTAQYIDISSIRNLVSTNVNNLSFSELLRGISSLGTFLEDEEYETIPSIDNGWPTDAFYGGGYNTDRHGSRYGGTIDGIQIECNRAIRFDEEVRQTFASHLAEILLVYLKKHYFPDLEDYYAITSALSEILTKRVGFYPNPVSDILHIETLSPAEVRIFNLYGQEVYSSQVNAEKDISLGHLGKGLYIIVFRQNGNIIGKGKLLLAGDH